MKLTERGLRWTGNLLVLVCAFLSVSASLLAQLPTGTILGMVKDPTGAVVAGAAVTVTNIDTGLSRNAVTEADGSYRVPDLPVGNYRVQVTHEGFQTAERTGLTLEVTQEAVVDITLSVGSTTQTVTVTEAAPLVDTTSSSVGGTVNEERIADLPLNGRNWTDLTLLQTGVTKINLFSGLVLAGGFNGTIYSSNGAQAHSNMYLLDGADERSVQGYNNSSITSTSLGVEGIKEYKVVSVLPDASYGMAMGSQTTLVSKGGTNQFHGDAFEYIRNSSLDARNYFDALDVKNSLGFGTDKSIVYPDKRIPPYRRNNFGGSFGGPIRKDKTFFYAVFEGIQQAAAQTVTKTTMPTACFVNSAGVLQSVVPAQIDNNGTTGPIGGTPPNPYGTCAAEASPFPSNYNTSTDVITVSPIILPMAEVYPQPNVTGYPTFNYTFPFIQPSSEQYGQLRLDQNISSSDSIFFRYTVDDASQTDLNSFQQFDTALGSATKFATVSETHIFSPSLLNTFRASYSRVWSSLANTTGTGNLAAAENPAALMYPSTGLFESLSPGSGVSGTGAAIGPAQMRQNLFTWSDDLFWTRGKHALRFGTLINYYQTFYAYVPGLYLNGILSFASLPNFFNADYRQVYVSAPGSNFARDWHYGTFGFYVQDDYRVSNRLTLNIGLRQEHSQVPTEVNPALRCTVRDPETDTSGLCQPGPIFTGPFSSLDHFSPRFGFAWDPFGKGETSISGGGGIYYDIANYGIFFDNQSTSVPPLSESVITVNSAATPAIPLTIPLTGALAGIGAAPTPPGPRAQQYDLRQPTLAQYALTVQQQLPWKMGLSVSYVGSRGWNLYQDREGDPTVPVGTDSRGLPVYGCWNATLTNYVLPGTNGACAAGFSTAGARINPALGETDWHQSEGNSYYNSFQLALNKRISQGLQFQFNYTISKLLDDGVGNAYVESTTNLWEVPDGYNTSFDRGPSVFDTPQNLRVNLIYHAPTINSTGALSKLANGWWFSSIISAQSGYPITPVLSVDRALQNDNEEAERPNLDPSFNKSTAVIGSPTEWFNPTMFDVPVAGILGNAGRGILRGPGYSDLDFSIVKDTNAPFLGEAGSIEFRTEVFNALNHPDFALPVTTVWSGSGAAAAGPAGEIGTTLNPAFATAGQISSTVNTSRQIQFALKLIF